MVPTREVVRAEGGDTSLLREIAGGDFNGDGLLDLAFSEGLTVELWLNRGEDGFETIAGRGRVPVVEPTLLPVRGALALDPAVGGQRAAPAFFNAEVNPCDLHLLADFDGDPVRQVWAGSLAAGEHRLAWDGRDAAGQPVAAGVYWYRVRLDDQTSTRKLVKIE